MGKRAADIQELIKMRINGASDAELSARAIEIKNLIDEDEKQAHWCNSETRIRAAEEDEKAFENVISDIRTRSDHVLERYDRSCAKFDSYCG